MASSSSLPSFRHLLTTRDLHDSANLLPAFINIFNRRLTKRMAGCQMQILCCDSGDDDDDDTMSLRGGVKVSNVQGVPPAGGPGLG